MKKSNLRAMLAGVILTGLFSTTASAIDCNANFCEGSLEYVHSYSSGYIKAKIENQNFYTAGGTNCYWYSLFEEETSPTAYQTIYSTLLTAFVTGAPVRIQPYAGGCRIEFAALVQ